ncbi:MAG: hypothetical protein QOH15_2501 [Gaiellales bacterium]|nr:hypothetical protein [Gaiellales bacterium]
MTTVTCVILSHNHRDFAVQAVESALAQSYPRELLDVVILDDGSRDGTGELLEQTFCDNPRVTVLRQENQGFTRSTNRVVAAATGDLIGFLDGDDMWHPERIRRQIAVFEARPDVGLVHSDMEIVDAGGALIHPSFFGYSGFGTVPRGRILGTLLHRNVVTTSSILVRASLRERFMPIPEELVYSDWHVAVRVAEVAAIEHLDEALVSYRSHSSNMSLGGTGNKFFSDMRHNVRITRWHLRNLEIAAVTPGELVAAAQSMLTHATRAAAELGCWAADVLPVTRADRDAAAEACRAAHSAYRRGEHPAALVSRVRALAANPWDGAAHADLMIAAARVDPSSVRARPPETRTVGVLAFADELLAAPELLEAYAAAVSDADDVTLLIHAPASEAESATAGLAALAERAGLGTSRSADMLLVATGDEDELLAAPIRFVYSRRRPPAAFQSLTRLDEHGLAVLAPAA